jgi:hypothetical protein
MTVDTGAREAVERVRAFLTACRATPGVDGMGIAGAKGADGTMHHLTEDDLSAVLDEREQLRARLDALGELREEWATRDGGWIDEANIYATEAEAFAALYSGEDVVRRFVGDWVAVGGRVAPDAAADGHSATETDGDT